MTWDDVDILNIQEALYDSETAEELAAELTQLDWVARIEDPNRHDHGDKVVVVTGSTSAAFHNGREVRISRDDGPPGSEGEWTATRSDWTGHHFWGAHEIGKKCF
jgi:hypothetical protein